MGERTVKDKRRREWETFCDLSYYDFWCVRPKGDRDFNSELSFHFMTYDQADDFMNLLEHAH